MPFARSALLNLDSAYNLFESVKENDRAAKVLVRVSYLPRAMDAEHLIARFAKAEGKSTASDGYSCDEWTYSISHDAP